MKVPSVAIGIALAIASLLSSAGTASAFPKCNVPDCQKLGGTHTRSQVQEACDKSGGIATGTKASGGGFGCVSQEDKGGWVQCDSHGKCIGGSGGGAAKKTPPGKPLGLGDVLGTASTPARK